MAGGRGAERVELLRVVGGGGGGGGGGLGLRGGVGEEDGGLEVLQG